MRVGAGRVATGVATGRVDQLGKVTMTPDPPVVGRAVVAMLVDADGGVTNEVWRWERSPGTGEVEWSEISGARASTYTPTETDDPGRLLRVTVTYDDGVGTGRKATSGASGRVDREGVVSVSPSPPVAGVSVTATLADGDGGVVNEEWKWERSVRTGTPLWEVISGAEEASYTPVEAEDGGKILRVTVTYDDAVGTGRVAVSASTLPVDRPGVVSLSTSTPVVGEVVTASVTDGDEGILNEEWHWEGSPDQGTPTWSDITGAQGCDVHAFGFFSGESAAGSG